MKHLNKKQINKKMQSEEIKKILREKYNAYYEQYKEFRYWWIMKLTFWEFSCLEGGEEMKIPLKVLETENIKEILQLMKDFKNQKYIAKLTEYKRDCYGGGYFTHTLKTVKI